MIDNFKQTWQYKLILKKILEELWFLADKRDLSNLIKDFQNKLEDIMVYLNTKLHILYLDYMIKVVRLIYFLIKTIS